MDYCMETLNFQLQINREFNKALFEQMENESAYIISCIESMQIVTEAEAQPPQAGVQKKGIFQKIIGFIKHIVKMFADKTGAMIERNKEWMDANAEKLNNIDYGGLQIEMVPFWAMNFQQVQANSQKLSSKIYAMLKSNRQVNKYGDMEAVKTNLFKEYLDENGDLTNGLKNYMRTGNAKGPIKPVILKDQDLKAKVTGEFLTYCREYGTTVLPFVKKTSDEAQRQLTMISNTLDKKQPAKESFCLIENARYADTDVMYHLMEAEQPANNNQQQASTNQNQQQQQTKPATNNNEQKQSVTKVQMTDHGNRENANQQEALDNMSTQQLTFLKNIATITQTTISTLMTALEERYLAYMAAMKQIAEARKAPVQQQQAEAAPQENNTKGKKKTKK